MADGAAEDQDAISPAQSPLVAVTFQKNVHRKEKYLEAEPQALGITQIGLSLFQIISVVVFLAKDLTRVSTDIPFFISSLLVVIAGSVAVAAKNLHVPTLRACLGMQIVAVGAAVFNFVLAVIKMEDAPYYCWHYYYDNFTLHYGETCRKIENVHSHFHAESMVVQVVLVAISATLAIYSCKVVNCCAPAPKMPVITVQVPPVQQ
ncbi:membrane-spanning 4-domains subfamily A member 4A-like [Antennarius striatus]|uniref:membrane-spanning 4-domains subfamily A member 4A-like n=1 Tax=Antennarius striatus TaxID=241820 RepID=UPI0035B23A08